MLSVKRLQDLFRSDYMKNRRKLSLDKYGISGKRYKELCAFCEQYDDWKAKIARNETNIASKPISGMPYSYTGVTSDKTADGAIENANLRAKVKLVEETAMEASSEFYDELIANICYDVSVKYLIGNKKMPLSPQAFYDRRRYFFYLLDQKKD